MDRVKFTTSLIERAVNGKVAGFYDPVEHDTKALLHYKDNRECEIMLVRAGRHPKTAVHSIAVTEELMIMGFTVSTPVEIVNSFGKTQVRGTGQRLVAKDNYPNLVIIAP